MTDPKQLYTSRSAFAPTPAFWLAVLDDKSYLKVAAHPMVDGIDANEQLDDLDDAVSITRKVMPRNTTLPMNQRQRVEPSDERWIIYEKDSLPELRVISQAPNTPLAANPGYVYEIDEGEEAFIYVGDYGINLAHRDFSDPSRKIEWLYTPLTILRHHNTPTEILLDDTYDDDGHSTCVASKAAGRLAGSAKHATLVVVKMFPSRAGVAEVWDTIAHDIVSKGRTHHSVASSSTGSPTEDRIDRKKASDIMSLVRRGVPVFLAAGNGGGYVTTLPQRLADRPDNLWGPVVVGAVDNNGERASFSDQLRHGRMLWAPGVEIECAAESPENRIYWEQSGTSFGVVAEQLTDMNRRGLFYPPLRDKYIYDNLQWKRPSGLPVIWNRMDGTKSPPGVSSNFSETATA
ncbi:MAG: hypothetical protein Q9212_003830 [Teloschistes hypoglaucus]